MKKTSGFTLIELMVVVIVIAVLAAIAIPSYLNQTRKSRRNAAEATTQQIALLEERYRADNPTYLAAPTPSSTNWSKLGTYPGNKYYSYVVTVAASTSVAPATYTITVSGQSTQLQDRSNGTSCATLVYGTTTTGTISKTPTDCW